MNRTSVSSCAVLALCASTPSALAGVKVHRTMAFFAALLVGAMSSAGASACDLVVPSPRHESIQSAIDAANAGDVICVAPGTYTETLSYDNKAITLQSIDGPATTIIDGGGAGPVIINMPTGSVLDGFTIQNGEVVDDGGGILIDGTSPTIRNCTFQDNEAGAYGGAILIRGASNAQIINCTFESNTAGIGGGAIGMDGMGGAPVIRNSTFESNSADEGGAIALCDPNGGGCDVKPQIINCTFHENDATFSGGAMTVYLEADALIVNSVFNSNSAGAGGALDVANDAAADVVNGTFFGNVATTFHAGAILALNDSVVTVFNSIFSGNTSPVLDKDHFHAPGNAAITLSFSTIHGDMGDGDAVEGNVLDDPDFVNPPSDLRLNAGSPSIDVGSNSAYFTHAGATAPLTDLDGQRRIRNGGNDCTIDMGAYEFIPTNLDDNPDIVVLASTNVVSGGFDSIGAASISAAGDRVVFSGITTGSGARIYLWDAAAGFDPADSLPAVDAHIDDLSDGGTLTVHIGGVVMQRSGNHIAYITQVNQGTPQLWLMDITDPTDATQTPVEINIGATGTTFTMLGQLSIDEQADPRVSFWKLTCDGGTCEQHIMESAAVPADDPTLIADAASGDAVFGPERAPDGSQTLYLQMDGGTLSLRSDDAGQPLVYEAATLDPDIGIISAVATNGASVAAYVEDPVQGVDPAIFAFDLGQQLNPAADVEVRLNGTDEAVVGSGIFLEPAANVRPVLNVDDDLAFAAIDVTEPLHLEALFARGEDLTRIVSACNDVVEQAEVSSIEVLGISDQDGGMVQVLFRAIVEDADETWSVLAKVEAQTGTPVPTCPDLTGNGSVGVPDLLALLGCFGAVVPGCEAADFDGNGTVGVPDLLFLLSHFGQACP